MSFDQKMGLLANPVQQILGDAHINIDHPVALGAGHVVVMVISACPVSVGAIGKIDAVQQAMIHQKFNRAKYRRPADMREFCFR